MLGAAAAMGFGAARASFKKEKEDLNEKIAILEEGIQTAKADKQSAESKAKQAEQDLKTASEKLKRNETALNKASAQITDLRNEKHKLEDSLKQTERALAKASKKPRPTTSTKPEEDKPAGTLQPGTPGLPAGISKGSGGIKRPGE